MATVVIFQPVVNAYSLSVTFPHVRRTVNQIHFGAQRLAPRGTHRSGSGERADGPNLQSSIEDKIDVIGDVIDGRVGSRKKYAASKHQGSRPHRIVATSKVLKFEWERGRFSARSRRRGPSRFFFFLKVNHPGDKRPVRYLTTPMHMYGRMNGFATTSSPVSRSRLP